MNFVIRADASNSIGTGHVMRCIALGQMLQDDGHNVIFATMTSNDNLLDRLNRERFKVVKLTPEIPLDGDAQKTVEIANENSSKWIITDGYKFTTDYQKIIKSNGFKLMCIDDIAECHYVSDVVLNQNLNAEKIFNYSCEPNTKLLLGIEYVLLRREFRDLKGWQRQIKNECKNILVTMGGSDPENFTLKVLEALELTNLDDLEVSVLIGVSYIRYGELINFISKSKINIKIHQNVENIVPIIQWCDLAISSAGSTVWELIILQTPIIVGILADNQEKIASELIGNAIAEKIGWMNEISLPDLSLYLHKVLSSSEIISNLRKNLVKFSKVRSELAIKNIFMN